MRKFLPLFLLLISLSACVSTKKSAEFKPPTLTAVLKSGYNTALYQTQIDYKENHFSGLFYFKNMKDSATRIVFLSEMGMGFFEFEYKKGNFKVISCQDFFNKQIILKTLQKDLELLIDFPEKGKVRSLNSMNALEAVMNIEHKGNKYAYTFINEKQITHIGYDGFMKKVSVSFSDYNSIIPQKIKISHEGLPLKLEFNLVKVN